jgi:hypothetical protein
MTWRFVMRVLWLVLFEDALDFLTETRIRA